MSNSALTQYRRRRRVVVCLPGSTVHRHCTLVRCASRVLATSQSTQNHCPSGTRSSPAQCVCVAASHPCSSQSNNAASFSAEPHTIQNVSSSLSLSIASSPTKARTSSVASHFCWCFDIAVETFVLTLLNDVASALQTGQRLSSRSHAAMHDEQKRCAQPSKEAAS